MRIFLIFIAICIIVATPFLIWGEWFESLFSGESAVQWLQSYGSWAWAAAILLLVSDLLLPIPATAVMGALGIVYGPFVGGLVGAFGSVCSGLLAYVLCRRYGRAIAVKISSADDMAKSERFFGRYGGLAIAVSRWMPVLPEALSCLAGLARMRFTVFVTALICGSLPMALLFAWIGVNASANALVALSICAFAPIALFIIALGIMRIVAKTSK